MKKAFDQTFRDIKREVNKKVLKVPSVEQKVLDATSNEPWGPHGSLLADIAQASKNYHEYQMIMSVIWKRINDMGKNWRHVYKALTVLEYLVANGSERVIDEIREHSYQIQTLSDFQYIDSSGRDQGNNVRKKSQSLVVLVNDKERISEARQKAAANRDKYRNTTGSMYRPGSSPNAGGYGGYDDDRYGGKDEDRNGYGREREWGNRDDVYGRYGDTYGRDADKYGRDYEDRYSRDGYRDDDYRGRSPSIDYNQYGSRSRSSDRYREQGYEDDGQYSSRGSGGRADDQSQDGSTAGRRLERKFSEQNLGAPPSYEEAIGVSRSPTHSEQGRDLPPPSVPKSSPPASSSPVQSGTAVAPVPAPASPPASALSPAASAAVPLPVPTAAAPPQSPLTAETKDVDNFDEFDPRGSFSAVPATSHATGLNDSGGAEMDLLGSLSDSFHTNSLALVPAASAATETDASVNSSSGPTPASSVCNQTFDDPFGDGPFKAIPSTDSLPAQPQNVPSVSSSHQSFNQSSEVAQLTSPEGQGFSRSGDAFPGATYMSPGATNVQPPVNMQFSQQESSTLSPEIDILADILPFTGGPPLAEASYPVPTGQPLPQVGFPPQAVQTAADMGLPSQPGLTSAPPSYPTQSGQPVGLTSFPAQPRQPPAQANFEAQTGQLVPQNFYAQMNQPASLTGFPAQAGQPSHIGFPSQASQPSSVGGFQPQMVTSTQLGFHSQSHQNATYESYNPHKGSTGPVTPQMTSQVSISPALQNNSLNILPQPSFSAPASSSHMNLSSPQHAPVVSQSMTSTSSALGTVPQPGKDKFETKSTVWADTLSRGLVNLNISGPKINPLADIGVDFDAINRKEKRMEKPSTAPVTSTITMGKAMGSGSGIGRAGAGAGVMRPAQNPMMGSGMGMGVGMGMGIGMGAGAGPVMSMGAGGGPGMNMGPGAGVGMGMGAGVGPGMSLGAGGGPGMGMRGYGSVNQPMGMNMNPNMAMGMGQGAQMQRPMGYPPGGYNPMMGPGNYSQQPYGGGYR